MRRGMRWLALWTLSLAFSGCVIFEPEFSRNPHSARVVSDDIARFWNAFDAAYESGVTADARPGIYQRLYLDPGTNGLDEFVERRIESAARLATTVNAARMYYESIRTTTLGATSSETMADVRGLFQSLLVRYGGARFPDVHFLVGRLSTGGTLSDVGIMIGVEMFSRGADTPVDGLTEWAQAVTRGSEYIPAIVAHELIHAQQKHPAQDGDNLLAFAITEGMADFVGEMLSGLHANPHVHTYANPVERELWEEFEADMSGTDFSGWLFNVGESSDERPADLGYYFGYRISEAYYAQASDKERALKEMFEVSDYEHFLARSGYDP